MVHLNTKQLAAYILVIVVAVLGTLVWTKHLVRTTTSKIQSNVATIQNLEHRTESNVNKIQTIENIQQRAAIAACHRLNILRASDNRSHYADFKFFTLTTSLLKVNLERPSQPITARQKQQTVQYINQLEQSANAKTWIYLTPCNSATTNPVGFKIPTAIRFKDQIPPKSVYHVAKGE